MIIFERRHQCWCFLLWKQRGCRNHSLQNLLEIDCWSRRETSGGRVWNKAKTERSEDVTFNLSDCSGWQERMLSTRFELKEDRLQRKAEVIT